MKDDLRPEYNLNSLRVRKVGSDRKSFGDKTINLESDNGWTKDNSKF